MMSYRKELSFAICFVLLVSLFAGAAIFEKSEGVTEDVQIRDEEQVTSDRSEIKNDIIEWDGEVETYDMYYNTPTESIELMKNFTESGEKSLEIRHDGEVLDERVIQVTEDDEESDTEDLNEYLTDDEDIEVTSFVAPSEASVGEDVRIYAEIENSIEEMQVVSLYVDDEKEVEKEIPQAGVIERNTLSIDLNVGDMISDPLPKDMMIRVSGSAGFYSRRILNLERPDEHELELERLSEDTIGEFDEDISLWKRNIRENIHTYIQSYVRSEENKSVDTSWYEMDTVPSLFGQANEDWLEDPDLLKGDYELQITLEGIDLDVESASVLLSAGGEEKIEDERIELDDAPPRYGSTAVDEDKNMYFVSQNQSEFKSLDSEGNERWTFTAENHFKDATVPVLGEDDTVYFNSWSNLYAIDTEDGTERWRFETEEENTTVSSPVVGPDGTIYVGYVSYSGYENEVENEDLFALNPDGTVKWRFEMENGIPSFPYAVEVDDDGTVYASTHGGVLAIDSEGNKEWEYGAMSPTPPTLSDDGTLYFVERGELIALNSDGEEKWTYDLHDGLVEPGLVGPVDELVIEFAPTVGPDGNIYVNSGSWITAVSPDGTERWRRYIGEERAGPRWDEMCMDEEGTLYFSNPQRMYVLRHNGDLDGVFEPEKWLGARPMIGPDGDVYITSGENMTIFEMSEDPDEHTLTIDVEGEGTTDPSPDTHTYDDGEEVTIEAIPDDGWVFTYWEGDYPDGVQEEDEITITMDEDKEITAVFEEEEIHKYDLSFEVEDEKGELIEGAEVTVNGDTLETDEDGEVVFEDMELGTYDYIVEKDGFVTVEDDVTIKEEGVTESVTLEVDDAVEEYDLTFEVEDEDGNAIEGAIVEVNGMEETTDSEGEAVFEDLEPSTYEYEVTHEDFETEEGEVEIEDEDETETVTMEEEDDEDTPGFTSMILVLGMIIAVAIYQKKKQ